jgi:hypothetical protein
MRERILLVGGDESPKLQAVRQLLELGARVDVVPLATFPRAGLEVGALSTDELVAALPRPVSRPLWPAPAAPMPFVERVPFPRVTTEAEDIAARCYLDKVAMLRELGVLRTRFNRGPA